MNNCQNVSNSTQNSAKSNNNAQIFGINTEVTQSVNFDNIINYENENFNIDNDGFVSIKSPTGLVEIETQQTLEHPKYGIYMDNS